MRFTSLVLVSSLCVSLLCFATAGCDTGRKAPPASPGASTALPADGGQLPAGHPPIDGGMGGMAGSGMPGSGMGGSMGGGMGGARAPAARGAKPLTWTVPSGWTETPPSSSMRLAQFEVANVDGKPIECKVFGGILGGVDGNIERWVGQFKTAAGGSVSDAAKVSETSVNGLKVTTLDVSGVFGGGMGASASGAPGESRMLAAIVEGASTAVQIQMVGPANVIAEHAARFQEFVNSLAPAK